MNASARMATVVIIGAALASCREPVQLVCTDQLNNTIGVRVLDAAGTPLQAATLVLRRGAFYDSVTTSEAVQPAGANYSWTEDRVPGGVYSLTVKKPGYVEQQRTVTVMQDECHSGPGPLVEVRLQPAGSI